MAKRQRRWKIAQQDFRASEALESERKAGSRHAKDAQKRLAGAKSRANVANGVKAVALCHLVTKPGLVRSETHHEALLPAFDLWRCKGHGRLYEREQCRETSTRSHLDGISQNPSDPTPSQIGSCRRGVKSAVSFGRDVRLKRQLDDWNGADWGVNPVQ